MECPCTFTVVVTSVLILLVSGTNRTFRAGRDVHRRRPPVNPDMTHVPKLDCQDRWTCEDYDYRRLSTSVRSHYLDKNCACDDLCLLLQDCCPDAPRLPLLSLSRHGSAMEDGEVPEGSSPDGGKAAVEDQESSPVGSSGKGSSGLQTQGGQWWNISWSNGNSLNASRSGVHHNVYSQYSLDKDMFDCIHDQDINTVNNVSVVTRCPKHYEDEEVTQLCYNVTGDDMMTRLPVSGRESRVLYRNMFCAMCHEEPYLYWAVGVDCSSWHSLTYDLNTTTIPDLLNHTACRIKFQPPSEDFGWRPCMAGVLDQCSDGFPVDTAKGRHIVDSCERVRNSTQRAVFGLKAAYRNEFCSLCNNNIYPHIFCEPVYRDMFSVAVSATRSGLYSFSILLDINTKKGSATVGHFFDYETVERNESVSCEQGQVFDPFRSTCRPVTCGPGRHFIDNTCRKKQQPADGKTTILPNHPTGLMPPWGNFSMDVLPALDCAFIQLNDTEYRLFQNGTLELVGTDTFYNSSQYVYLDQKLYLCVSYTQNYTRNVTTEVKKLTFIYSLTETVVSTCGICISLVALAVTMLVYLSVRALRNIPGQNLLSLVCSLFLADLLLLVAPSAEGDFRACAVVAAVMHYFFLAAFLWMNVTAVDVWFTFSKAFVKAGDRGKSSKRFLMYSAYSWLTPLVFVLPAALLQVVNPGSPVSPGYGEGICWLTNKYALLLFFATPLFFLLLLNTVLFVLSARNICRAQRTTARMLGKEEEGKMGIYVRLTVVMGLTWILGFLAAWIPGYYVLPYCFIIMNTLQGLFIFLSFVCTPKVFALLKDKFCGRRPSRTSKSLSTDMTNVSKSPSATRKMSTASSKSHHVVM